MAIYLVPTPKRIDLRMAPLFNATTSDYSFGLAPSQNLFAQTALAYVYGVGTGENGLSYIWGKSDATNIGPALFIDHNSGSPRLSFYASSTGTAGRPLHASAAGSFTYGVPAHVGATWTGSLLGTDIDLFQGLNDAPITQLAVGTELNGTTAAKDGTEFNFHIGNLEGTARTFNGTIYYVARWNRVLSIDALRRAQMYGPLSVPDGLVLCWANNQDYSPTRLRYATRTAVVMTGPAPMNPLLQWDWRGPAAWPAFSLTDDTLLGQACL